MTAVEIATACRVCGQGYFTDEAPGSRCMDCEWCLVCDGPMPSESLEAFGSVCSAECNDLHEQESLAHKAEAEQRAAAVEYTAEWRKAWRDEIFERDGWVCHLCGEAIARSAVWPHSDSPVLDHVIPRSKGGSDDPSNLRAAHALCNNRRKDMDLGEFLASLL